MIRIRIGRDEDTGGDLSFDAGIVLVGRHPSNDIALPEAHVSGKHGEFLLVGGTYRYRDLGSTNGSFLSRDGALIQVQESAGGDVAVQDGDVLYIGDPEFSTCLRLSLPNPQAAAADTERFVNTGVVEVIGQVDMPDEAATRQLSAAFDREALVALHAHAARAARLRALPEILDSFADTALELYENANHVCVYLRDPRADELEPALSRGRSGSTPPRRVSRTLCNLVRDRRQALTFSVYDPALDHAMSLKNLTVRAGMCAPLWSGEQLSGLVQVDWRGKLRVPFGQRDLAALAVLANELSLAVDRARLQDELERTIAELRSIQTEMEALAFLDTLTGLSNRRLLADRIEQSLTHARRHGRRFALLYLDLDGFKRVNDTFGHEGGDELLRTIAGRLRSCLRAQDTVARIGGDEFAALLFDVTDATAARTVALKMLERVREPVELRGHRVSVIGSMGIAVAPDDGDTLSTLLRNADLAMYKAKRRSGGTFQFFTEEMNREASRRLIVETELRQALASREFVEHFQPVVRMSNSEVVGYEALVRWNHPRHGLTMPDDFIRIAEESGLIVPLGNWVLQAVCDVASRLNRSGAPALRMSVNISPRQFVEPDLPERVATALRDSGLPAEQLVVEITESILMEDTQEALAHLSRLKDLGVALCVDDFGTGFSSLSYLKRFPVDLLKIDRSFTSGIPDDKSDVEIAAAVIAMAHKLNIRVVAEGVENQAQADFLRSNACDFAQGFLFGEPSETVDLLERRAAPAEPGARA